MFSSYFPPQYSGAAKQAISLARYLRGLGHSIEFVTVRWPGLEKNDSYEGFPVFRVETGKGQKHKELRLWWNLLRYVMKRRKDFDILHSHGAYYTNSIVGPLAKIAGLKSLVKASLAVNDLHGLRQSLSGHIHYAFLGMVDAYVAISRDLEHEFIDACLPRDKVHYLPNGVDTDRFHPLATEAKAKLRQRLGLPLDRALVLTIGVFDQRKNIGWLMEEWVRNRSFGTGALLLAIGPQSREDTDGTFFAALQRLTDENSETLSILGHVDEIELYYRAADLFILPSYSEGMPNVILEAMASGLPCVATRVSGVTDLVQEAETGYTFTPGDAQSLKEALLMTLNDVAGCMGQRARTLAEEKYSIEALAERYDELYRTLMVKEKFCQKTTIESTHNHA
ncbi:MAG: glycosyltransferase family 1 protein [Desulfuromonadales bacterium]|nr:MAG: glycosyltransferase family 1 protein [Desulfuromonadales bacterium]